MSDDESAPYTTLIDVQSGLELLDGADVRWLDCRFRLDDPDAGRRAHAEAHVPGAIYVHLDEDLSAPVVAGQTGRHPLPSVDVMTQRLRRWGICHGDQVVVYDDMGGAIAARAWWMLRWLGHDAVAVLDGGWPAWREAGGPEARDEVLAPTIGDFVAAPRPELLADADAVASAASDPAMRVFDARKAERFRGEVEPIDPVAGHVPGAVSLPFPDNLDPSTGRFRSRDALRRRFEAALGTRAAASSIVYCGSGVTACHDLLAMAHAGLAGARLYPGSWSHWITDPARPIARG